MGVVISSPIKINVQYPTTIDGDLTDAQFERWLSMSLQKRASKWCRLCLSDKCCHEKVVQLVQTKETTNLIRKIKEPHGEFETMTQLQRVKQKLQRVLAFLEKTRNVNEPLCMARYSLLGIQQRDATLFLTQTLTNNGGILTLHLIPLFPTSEDSMREIESHVAGLPAMDARVSDEYFSASQSPRRIRLSLETRNCDVREDSSAFDVSCNDMLICLSEEVKEFKHTSPVKSSYHRITRRERFKLGDFARDAKTLDPTFHSNENQYYYRSVFKCNGPSLTDSRMCRIQIKGDFHERNSNSLLPFQLIIFQEQNPHYESTGLSGTYTRRIDSSKFSLRWKFSVQLKA